MSDGAKAFFGAAEQDVTKFTGKAFFGTAEQDVIKFTGMLISRTHSRQPFGTVYRWPVG